MSARFDFFSIDTYNRLPSLGEAHAVYIDNDGEQFLLQVVQPMMLRHGVQNVFAINLVYTHTHLQHGQRVVGMAASSRPMMCDSDHDGTLRSLFPASWTITSDGRMMECEYGFLPRGHTPPPLLDDEAYDNFLAEFIEATRNANLDRVLGLVLRSPGDLVLLLEVSEGEERHVFWPQDYEAGELAGCVDTAWAFWPATGHLECFVQSKRLENGAVVRGERFSGPGPAVREGAAF